MFSNNFDDVVEIDYNDIQKRGNIGVIHISLEDSFSKLIKKISSNPWNIIGVYYSSLLKGSSNINIMLYNTHNNSCPQWLLQFQTLDSLLSSPLISKIILQPFQNIDETILAIAISNNIDIFQEKDNSDSYKRLFLLAAGDVGNLPMVITGYDIIKKIATNLQMDIDYILSEPLLIKIPTYSLSTITEERQKIDNSNKKELSCLSETYIDLFINNLTFHENFFDMHFSLGSIFEISTKEIKSNKITKSNKTKISVAADSVDIGKQVLKLHEDLQNIVDQVNIVNLVNNPINIPLNQIISDYNEIVKILPGNNPSIKEIPKDSFLAVISDIPEINMRLNDKNKIIPIQGANLSELSKDQLLGLIEYIDLLSDQRFVNLQLNAIKELSLRE